MLYRKYKNKIDKRMKVLSLLIKMRWLIIGVAAFCIALTSVFLGVKGVVVERNYTASAKFAYGETIGYSAKALFSKVRYEYRQSDGSWSDEKPTRVGDYEFRTVTTRSFGKIEYGNAIKFAIQPQKVKIELKADSAIYGEKPDIKANLSYSDKIVDFTFNYGKIADEASASSVKFRSHGVASMSEESDSSGVTALSINTDSLVVKNDAGEDVSDQYEFSFDEAEVSLLKRKITFSSLSKEFLYDDTEKFYNEYEITEGSLAFSDTVDSRFEKTINDVGRADNAFNVSIRDVEGRDVTELYEITKNYGVLSVVGRELNVSSKDAEFTYDGDTHEQEEFVIDEQTPLADGHEVRVAEKTQATDVGEYQNEISVGVFDSDGNDVTACYILSVTYGKITITRRKISVGTATSSFVYDDTAHYDENCSADNLAKGHSLLVVSHTEITDVNESGKQNVLEVNVVSGEEDKTDNYDITYEYGTLTVTKRGIKVTTATSSFVYDGTALYDENCSADNLVKGHSLRAVSHTEITDVNESGKKNVSEVKVVSGEEDKTDNYDITYEYGTLTVTKREIKVITETSSFVYDDTAHYDENCSADNLVEGHSLLVVSHTKITNVNKSDTENILEVKVVSDEKDKTDNYLITYSYGKLTVTPRPITITTGSAEKVYDDTPLTCSEYTTNSGKEPDKGLVKGHEIGAISITGTITDVGEEKNAVDTTKTVIVGKDGNAVTDNYRIDYADGVLTITARPVTVTTATNSFVYDDRPHYDENCTAENLVKGHSLLVVSHTEITNVNESGDNVLEVKVMSGEEEKTANYEVTYEYGILTVTKRNITVTTATNSFVYDDTAHYDENCSADNLVKGHSLLVVSHTKITDVNESGKQNVLKVNVLSGNVDKTENYNISYEYGTLTVTKRFITVTTATSSFVYDDTAHYDENCSADNLVEGHSLRAVSHTEITDVNESGKQNVLKVNVLSGNVDKTDNYDITYEYGTLTVTKRFITVTTATSSFVYDDRPHYDDNCRADNLVEGHSLLVVSHTEITDVKESGDNVLVVKVMRGEEEKTENYEITYVNGTITVLPRPLVIITGPADKIYDNTPLTCNKYSPKKEGDNEGLVEWHKIGTLLVTGTITNVGETENCVDEDKTLIIGKNGKDVTENYKITYEYGVLTVTPRPITITTGSATKVYDNKPLFNHTYEITSEMSPTMVYGQHEVVEFVFDGGIINVSKVYNDVMIKIIDDLTDEDLTYNYDITHVCGVLEVTPRIVTYSTENAEKVYDGTLLTSAYSYDTTAVLSEHQVELSFTQILVGTKNNELVSYRITDEKGNEVCKENYKFVPEETGVLNVIPIKLIVSTGSAEKIYDGEPLSCKKYEIVDGSLVTGDYIDKSTFNEYALPGEYNNYVTLDILNQDEINVSAGYKIEYAELGIIKIKARVIHVTTGSAKKVYDGKPLTSSDYFITGIEGIDKIPDNLEIRVTTSGTITEVGSVQNVGEGYIFDTDVGGKAIGYELVLDYGLLKVVEKQGNSYGGSLNSSGGLAGQDREDGSGAGKTIAFEVVGETNGSIYLRFKSFGDYTGRGWSEAKEYDGRINGEYSYNYLNALLLDKCGYKAKKVKIKSYAGYMLPYYLALSGEGYKIQSSDVLYDGSIAEEYTVPYYAFDFNKDYSLINGGITGEYAESEKLYYDFLCKNYLSVPDDTKTYLQNLINKNGWTTSYSDLVKIAEYVQGAAKYNLKYDSRMDFEPDVVVAFLEKYKEGVCRHYASAATLIYRTLGIPARYTIGYTGNVKNGEKTEIETPGHAWVEIYLQGFGWVKMEVTGGGFGGDGSGGGSGGGEQGKTKLIIKPVDVDKVYDGTPLYAKNEVEGDKLSLLLDMGYTYDVSVEGSRTDYGESDSIIKRFVLYDSRGRDVTDLFEIESRVGKISITGPQIIIRLYEKQKTYDGTPLFYEENDYIVENLPAGYQLKGKVVGSITAVGTLELADLKKSSSFKIFDKHGNDVTDDFTIKFVGKPLTVIKRIITIATATDEKEYDGEPFEVPDAWVSIGSLASGDTIKVVTSTSVTDIGEYDNVVKVKIYNSKGVDVSNNYEIKYDYGTLTVY